VIIIVDKYSKFVSVLFLCKPQALYIKTFHQNSYTGRMQSFLSDLMMRIWKVNGLS